MIKITVYFLKEPWVNLDLASIFAEKFLEEVNHFQKFVVKFFSRGAFNESRGE
jgi:hypothetical protein